MIIRFRRTGSERLIKEINVLRKRGKGRLKKRWIYKTRSDNKIAGVTAVVYEM